MAPILAGVPLLILTVCFSCSYGVVDARVSCKNAMNQEVDWFVLYKIPKTKPNNRNYIQPNGTEMAYYDSTYTTSKAQPWTFLPDIYSKKANPIKETLAPIYTKNRLVSFVAYNDQPPDNFNGTRGGHSKGVLIVGKEKETGVAWLQHSVPRFVEDVKNGYAYPKSGRENGQLFFCLSLSVDQVEKVAYHLHVQGANVYQKKAETWAKAFPKFWLLLQTIYIKRLKSLEIDILLTEERRRVLAIAKAPKWPRDVYTEDLGIHMKDNIVVQSWQNGAGGAQKAHCKVNYKVTDVKTLYLRTNKRDIYFPSSEDHSKWYVTKTKGYFCYSTLNRMTSQIKRGGEITCLLDFRLSGLFKKSIFEESKC
uniref:Putative deoxyribonuclease ii n=1 Tax=Rhipicephalus pulchellus TaxID=72859 RepID=L7M0V1_RHIPC